MSSAAGAAAAVRFDVKVLIGGRVGNSLGMVMADAADAALFFTKSCHVFESVSARVWVYSRSKIGEKEEEVGIVDVTDGFKVDPTLRVMDELLLYFFSVGAVVEVNRKCGEVRVADWVGEIVNPPSFNAGKPFKKELVKLAMLSFSAGFIWEDKSWTKFSRYVFAVC